MIVIAAIGGLITFPWARDLFGPMAGAFAAGLYSFLSERARTRNADYH
jgi:hypothetical protein